jgi:hypothetical protein
MRDSRGEVHATEPKRSEDGGEKAGQRSRAANGCLRCRDEAGRLRIGFGGKAERDGEHFASTEAEAKLQGGENLFIVGRPRGKRFKA